MQARQLEKAPKTTDHLQKSKAEGSTATRVSRAGHVLLQLQKQYGNRYVQRLLTRARQDQNEREAPAEIGEAIARQQGLGQPLDRGVRNEMEPAFGTSFKHVRVHTGPPADQLNRAVNARAFTTGRDIFFRTGEYSPGTFKGRELLAHELTHVVQQTGTVQPKLLISQPNDPYEQEADRVAHTIMQAQRAPRYAQAKTATLAAMQPQLQRGIFGDVWDAASGAVSSAASAVSDFAGNVIDRAVNYIKDRARSIPGYDLVAVILGRDPITQEPVERNATNLLRGLLGLIPGGSQIFENLQRSGVIQRAFDWVSGELTRLNLTWPVIRGAIQRFLNSLSPGDVFHLGDVFDRVRAIFGPIVSNLISFARAAGGKILEFIFEGALALGGSAAQRILGIFRRIGASFSLIVSDPVRFLQNLIGSVGGAFRQFGANILGHLRTAVFEWLFGALQGTGLQLPQRFDARGIISLILQILGLTYARLRARLVRVIGERPVQLLEEAFEFLRILVTQGIAAAWEKILEYAENLTETIIEGIKSWIRNTIVMQAIQQIASLLTPVGAIIQAIIKIYNTVMFVIERAQQLAEFVQSVIESVENIARGNLSSAISYVERTLARILPLVISFLARFIGLGGIGNRIREIIQRIQGVVDRAFERVVNWIRERARAIFERTPAQTGGPDTRRPEEQTASLRTAVAEAAQAVQRERDMNAQRHALDLIKQRHRITRLDVVTDAQSPQGRRVHIHAEVNPTWDGEGFIISELPPGPAVVIVMNMAAPPGRAGLERVLPGPTAVGLPASWVRAHLVGQGFGQESPHGIFYAPGTLNGKIQNESIEAAIRGLYAHRVVPNAEFQLTASAEPHENPPAPRLAHVNYDLIARLPGGRWMDIFEADIWVADSVPSPSIRVAIREVNIQNIYQVSNYENPRLQIVRP